MKWIETMKMRRKNCANCSLAVYVEDFFLEIDGHENCSCYQTIIAIFLNFSQIFLILMNNRVTYILNKERKRKLRKIMIIVSFYCPQHFSSA